MLKDFYFTFDPGSRTIYGEDLTYQWVRVRAGSSTIAESIFLEQWMSKFFMGDFDESVYRQSKNKPMHGEEYCILTEKGNEEAI